MVTFSLEWAGTVVTYSHCMKAEHVWMNACVRSANSSNDERRVI
jgi:hypothetical protein